jgi:hypothetical protein
MGFCSGNNAPGWTRSAPGRGLGLGSRGGRCRQEGGRGRGWRAWSDWPVPSERVAGAPAAAESDEQRRILEGEVDVLRAEVAALREQAEQLCRRLEQLGAAGEPVKPDDARD